jgi:hypothetical protein
MHPVSEGTAWLASAVKGDTAWILGSKHISEPVSSQGKHKQKHVLGREQNNFSTWRRYVGIHTQLPIFYDEQGWHPVPESASRLQPRMLRPESKRITFGPQHPHGARGCPAQ